MQLIYVGHGRPVISPAPLHYITNRQPKRLYVTLWNWKDCVVGTTSIAHDNSGVLRLPAGQRLGLFQAFYKSTTARYLPEFAASGETALRSHDDLIDLLSYIKKRAEVERGQLMVDYSPSGSNETVIWNSQAGATERLQSRRPCPTAILFGREPSPSLS